MTDASEHADEPVLSAADAELADKPTGEILLPSATAPIEVRSPVAARARLATWALTLALLGLAASFLVGWAFPLGIAAIVVGIVALRRPWESRAVAIWALVLAVLSIVYSAGWLVYAALVTSGG